MEEKKHKEKPVVWCPAGELEALVREVYVAKTAGAPTTARVLVSFCHRDFSSVVPVPVGTKQDARIKLPFMVGIQGMFYAAPL